jgi:spermidine synthase
VSTPGSPTDRPVPSFEELDHRETPLGELVLRRRRTPWQDNPIVYEITLDGAFLMSSLVNDSEIALTRHALDAAPARPLDLLVGGLGLGHTASAALEDDRVASLVVVERLAAVIDWHRRGLVPLDPPLGADPRTRFEEDDVFVRLGPAGDDATYDLVLLDVDHSPRALLHPSHAAFYEAEGLARLEQRVRPGGLFGLWSADATDGEFLERLASVFDEAWVETIRFFNPHVGAVDVNSLYYGRRAE